MTAKCNLIIDSCCDLPKQEIDGEGITLLKFPFHVGYAEFFDDMFQTSSPHDFYEALRKGATPSTAQIPMNVMLEAFEQAAQSGIPTVFLCFSSQLSGTYSTAEMLLEQVKEEHPEAELYLVDTKLASVAEGLLVREAIAQRNKGLTARELAEWAQEARYFVHGFFMVDSLDALARGGRIPKALANIGSKLDVKPLLTFDLEGNLAVAGMARGRKKGFKQMVEYYQKNVLDSNIKAEVIIGDADCPRDAEKLMDMLKKDTNATLFLRAQIGPVIGCHVGPGMLACVMWGVDRREQLSVGDRIAKRVKGA